MRRSFSSRSAPAGVVAVIGLGLAACAPGGSIPRVMGGTGMMGDASGYRFSRITCAAPAGLPGHQVNVVLGDMGMSRMMGGTAPLSAHMMLRAAPATVAAGQVSLVASNMGWRTHELVILPLPAGVPDGRRVPGADGKVDESGSLGEASTSCGAGAGDGIRAGTLSWTTVDLAPGHYELVCNLVNHYADGMHQELVVLPA